MFQSHIKRGSDENVGFQLLTRHSIIQDFITTGMILMTGQYFGELGYFGPFIIKRRRIPKGSLNDTRLSRYTFHELSDGHTRGKSVRIDYNIWANPVFCKRHIFFRDNHSDGSFLSRPRRHFIADGRNACFSDADFCDSLAFFSFGHKRFVYKPQLTFFRRF